MAFSRKGRFKEKISAYSIRSREHARKLWPLVDPEPPHVLVTYVRPSFDKETDELRRRSYFAKLPTGKGKFIAKELKQEREDWHKQRAESAEHLKAKELLVSELTHRLQNTKSLIWAFKDPNCDFPIKGDLLLGAESIKAEHPFIAPFDNNYKLDIAVLGPVVDSSPLILAGIEIEFTHAFDGFRGLISKTLGFPVISVDIAGMELDDINEKWAADIIQSTTLTSEDATRKTFFYLHDLIYPQFIGYPSGFRIDKRHQFLVFAPDEDTNRLDKNIRELALKMGYKPGDVAVTKVTANSEQSKRQLQDLGLVVGSDWEQINSNQCLRIALDKPSGIDDLRSHRFHTALAKTLLSERDALVGYKYAPRIHNDSEEEDIWIYHMWQGPGLDLVPYKILPKRLVDPIGRILDLIEAIQGVGDLDDELVDFTKAP